jgi:hypothetical protein
VTRVIRSLLPALALSLAVPAAAQVGYPPDRSPYEDLSGRQGWSTNVGLLAPGWDPAFVHPRQGLLVMSRYELKLTNALWLNARLGLAPGLERAVKDPLFADSLRDFGTTRDAYALGDIGFGVNLTGNKSWRRVVPQVHGAIGFISTVGEDYDLGAYRFGTKVQISYGVGVRVVTRSSWEMHADITHMFWKYKYPAAYGGSGDASDRSIMRDRPLDPWKGNLLWQVGVSRYFFR